MDKQNWYHIAQNLLELMDTQMVLQQPPGELILLDWKIKFYVGSVQQIAIGYSPEIVFLSKTSKPIHLELWNNLVRVRPEITRLVSDPELDLEGITHVLRRVENQLLTLTSHQTDYVVNLPLQVSETNGNNSASSYQVHCYNRSHMH